MSDIDRLLSGAVVEAAHATLAPSAAKRWMHCPGSIALTAGMPDEDSVYGRMGTFGHEIGAHCLRNDLEASAMRGTKSPKGGEFTFDGSLEAGVQEYLNVVRTMQLMQGGTLLVEQKVRLTPLVWGTADAMLWSDDKRRLDIIDLKLGAGVYVEVVDNEQLIVYALAALAEAGIPPSMMAAVGIHIVQPLYSGAAPHRFVEITGAELQRWRERIAQAELETQKPGAKLCAGEWCRWCKGKPKCPQLQVQAMQEAQDLFPLLDPTASPVAPPLFETYSPAKLAKILAGADVMESWVKAARDHAYRVAKTGVQIPGYKLIARVGRRKWVDPFAAAAAIKLLGFDPYAPAEVISPAQADKLGKTVKAKTAPLWVKPLTGTLLVPESDKRPVLNPADAFDVLPESEDTIE